MDTNSGSLLGNFTLPAAIPSPSTGLPQNLRDWQLAASLAQSRGLSEEAGTAAFLGQKISQNAAAITSEIRHDAAKITSTLQGGADQLASTLQIGNAISCVGFLAVLNGLHNIKNEQGKTTKAVEQVHATLEAMRVEQRFYAARQTEAIQAILEVLRESRSNEARQLVEQGEKNYKSGYIQESLERFKKALEFDNTDFFVHYQMGLAYAKLDDAPMAEGSLKRAIDFAPDNCPQLRQLAHVTMSRIMISQGKYQEALKHCQAALKIDPEDISTLLIKAEIILNSDPDNELHSLIRTFPTYRF